MCFVSVFVSRNSLLPAGPDSGNLYHYLIREEMLPDNVNAALLFTLLVTILKSSDSEHEQLFIYESLREGIVHMPDAFPVVYDILVPKMALVMQNSQNQQIIDACLAIMQSMFKPDMQNSKKRLNKDYVHAKLGFQGLIDSDTFSVPHSRSPWPPNSHHQLHDPHGLNFSFTYTRPFVWCRNRRSRRTC